MERTVYLVEDDDQVRDAFEFALNMAGHRVKSFINAKAAYHFFDSSPVDDRGIILLDMMTPEMDGIEFLARKEAELPALKDVPIVAMSATSREFLKLSNEHAFLQKPIDLDDLMNVIESTQCE